MVDKFRTLLTLVFFLLCFACSDSSTPDDIVPNDDMEANDPDEEEEPVAVNNAPEDFNLISVEDNAQQVELNPILMWEAAVDSDGDAVLYDLYIQESGKEERLVAENVGATSFSDELSLTEDTLYFWWVVAKDGNEGSTRTTNFSFETKSILKIELIVDSAEFSERSSFEAVSFKNKLWVFSGLSSSSQQDEAIWNSNDGITWTKVVEEAPFGSGFGAKIREFKGELWLVSSQTIVSNGTLEMIWKSPDGINWTAVSNLGNEPFENRFYHTLTVFEDKLWVIGGRGWGSDTYDDVWYSEDGEIWTETSKAAPFGEIYRHQSLVFQNKLWVIGGVIEDGNKTNKIWNTVDGENWNLVEQTSNIPAVQGHSTELFEDRIFLIGGDISSGEISIYYSSDGMEWKRLKNTSLLPARTLHASAVLNNQLFIIGGTGPNFTKYNDVWMLNKLSE